VRGKKVAIVTSSFLPDAFGGRETYTYHLAKQLIRYGFIVKVFSGGRSGVSIFKGISIMRSCKFDMLLDPNSDLKQHLFPFLFAALQREAYDADIIHAQEYGSISTDVAGFFSRISGKPLIITVHNPFLSETSLVKFLFNVYNRSMGFFSISQAAKVIFVSQTLKRKFVDLFPSFADKFVFIPNAVEYEEYEDWSASLSIREKSVLSMGRSYGPCVKAKNHQALIEAMPKIKAVIPSAQCFIVGPTGDYAKELKSLAGALGVAEAVTITGPKFSSEKIQLFKRAAVFVSPSLVEAFPTVLLEALAAGVPCVATNVGDTGWIIKDRMNGYLVSTDPQSIADGVIRILGDNEVWRTLSRNADNMARAYCWDRIMPQILEIYQECIEMKR